MGASALHGKVVRALMGCSRFYRAKMLRDAYSERERNILWSRLERVPNEHGADCRQERKRVQTGAAPWARGEGTAGGSVGLSRQQQRGLSTMCCDEVGAEGVTMETKKTPERSFEMACRSRWCRELLVALWAAVVGLVLCGCERGGYRVVSPKRVTTPWRPSYVVLYGIDPGAPAKPPEGCQERGVVEVWGKGEKAYHYGPFRKAARRLGGNGVSGIRRVRIERGVGGDTYHYEGTVVSCPLFEEETQPPGESVPPARPARRPARPATPDGPGETAGEGANAGGAGGTGEEADAGEAPGKADGGTASPRCHLRCCTARVLKAQRKAAAPAGDPTIAKECCLCERADTRARATLPPRGLPRGSGNDSVVIRSGAVGDIRVGKRLPAKFVDDAGKLEKLKKRYVAGFYADAQVYEGFRLGSPAILVALQKGPFYRWFEDPNRKKAPPPNPAPRFVDAAIEEAKAGLKVDYVVVEGAGAVTRKGIGVGSTLTELKKAYGSITLHSNPVQFGGDRCVAAIPKLKGVRAYFSTCEAARGGDGIVHIVVNEP